MGHTALSFETLAISHQVKYIFDDSSNTLIVDNIGKMALPKFANLIQQYAYHKGTAKISNNPLNLFHRSLFKNIYTSSISKLISTEVKLIGIGAHEQQITVISQDNTHNSTDKTHQFLDYNNRYIGALATNSICAENDFEFDNSYQLISC